jgi:hypothetical protein
MAEAIYLKRGTGNREKRTGLEGVRRKERAVLNDPRGIDLPALPIGGGGG